MYCCNTRSLLSNVSGILENLQDTGQKEISEYQLYTNESSKMGCDSRITFLTAPLTIHWSLFCLFLLFKHFHFCLWLLSFWHFSSGSFLIILILQIATIWIGKVSAPINFAWEYPQCFYISLFLMILPKTVTFSKMFWKAYLSLFLF